MGNSSTSVSEKPLGNAHGNATFNNTSFSGSNSLGLFAGFSWSALLSLFSTTTVDTVMAQCETHSDSDILLGIKIFVLLMGLPANIALMWLLLLRKGALSASEILGLNLSVMDVLYCLCLPLDIYALLHRDVSATLVSAAESFSALNIFGCPLLLACMCLERLLAAACPVAYMKLGSPKYRFAMCALAWLLTVVVGLLAYFLGVFNMVLYLAVSTSILFLVMLLCLTGITWVLCQKRPGDGVDTSMPLKRKALKTILAVMVPTVLAYSPLIALVPFMAVVYSQSEVTVAQCSVLQILLAFPDLGLYIGPLFYMSRVRQLSCFRKQNHRKQIQSSATQVE